MVENSPTNKIVCGAALGAVSIVLWLLAAFSAAFLAHLTPFEPKEPEDAIAMAFAGIIALLLAISGTALSVYRVTTKPRLSKWASRFAYVPLILICFAFLAVFLRWLTLS